MAAAASALSCAHGKKTKDTTLCPESQELVCLTAKVCDMDQARGCRVCQCSVNAFDNLRPENYGRPGMPPDRTQP